MRSLYFASAIYIHPKRQDSRPWCCRWSIANTWCWGCRMQLWPTVRAVWTAKGIHICGRILSWDRFRGEVWWNDEKQKKAMEISYPLVNKHRKWHILYKNILFIDRSSSNDCFSIVIVSFRAGNTSRPGYTRTHTHKHRLQKKLSGSILNLGCFPKITELSLLAEYQT